MIIREKDICLFFIFGILQHSYSLPLNSVLNNKHPVLILLENLIPPDPLLRKEKGEISERHFLNNNKMKLFVAIAICCLCVMQTMQAQTDSPDKKKKYQTWINTYDASRASTGVLYEIQDSSVTLSNRNFSRNGLPGKVDMTKLDVRSIDVIKVRKNGNIGQGILYGALTGLVVGGAVGLLYASTVEKHEEGANDLEKSFNSTTSAMQTTGTSILIGIGCIGTGIGVGALIGSAKITIPINGSQEQFNQNRPMLTEYSVKQDGELASKTFSKLRDVAVDIDGNVYPTLALGAQVWMAENLKVTHYRDGSEIQDVTKNDLESGGLYNWFAVNDNRKLCPSGWHVPFPSEWTSLFNSLGGENGAGRKMGEDFSAKGEICQWWSSTEQDVNLGRSLYLNNETMAIMITGTAKASGLSVRCIRDF